VRETRDLPGLLRDLVVDPGRPRVTWYGPGGERVELSGKTLLNWVSKTANLLVAELDAEPGTTVGLDLPAHWRTVSWVLATWAAGAHAVVAPEKPGLDVLVTTEPGPAGAGTTGAADRVVAVALPALATSFGAGLPPGVLDGAVEVRLQPDAFFAPAPPDAGDPALTAAGRTTAHGELLAQARDLATAAGVRPGDRVLTGASPDRALTAWLGVLALDGSLVLHHDAAGTAGTAGAVDAVAGQEGVTRRL
jgi:uncharacterized protein (TIGR03089 family)